MFYIPRIKKFRIFFAIWLLLKAVRICCGCHNSVHIHLLWLLLLINLNTFPVSLRNRLISCGLEPVLTNTKKTISSIVLYPVFYKYKASFNLIIVHFITAKSCLWYDAVNNFCVFLIREEGGSNWHLNHFLKLNLERHSAQIGFEIFQVKKLQTFFNLTIVISPISLKN